MDISNVVNSFAAQGVQGQRHHQRPNITDAVKQVQSLIDDAMKAGKLSSEQASAMEKVLTDIQEKLAKAQGSPDTTGTPQCSMDDRKQMRKELHNLVKQLFAAMNTQSSNGSGAADLFSKIDANSDGSIDKDEFSNYLSQMNNQGGRNMQNTVNDSATYGQGGTITISQTQITFSITA